MALSSGLRVRSSRPRIGPGASAGCWGQGRCGPARREEAATAGEHVVATWLGEGGGCGRCIRGSLASVTSEPGVLGLD